MTSPLDPRSPDYRALVTRSLMDPLRPEGAPGEGPHKRTRRRACSKLCIYAKGPKCACICGGANHGKAYRPDPTFKTYEEKDREQVQAAEDAMREGP
jgi:hypothetical protein